MKSMLLNLTSCLLLQVFLPIYGESSVELFSQDRLISKTMIVVIDFSDRCMIWKGNKFWLNNSTIKHVEILASDRLRQLFEGEYNEVVIDISANGASSWQGQEVNMAETPLENPTVENVIKMDDGRLLKQVTEKYNLVWIDLEEIPSERAKSSGTEEYSALCLIGLSVYISNKVGR